MPVAGGGFDQCCNAQAVVATESLLVIAGEVVQAPNDKQQIAPMLEKIDVLREDLGRPETLLADNGYFSEANVTLCAAANIAPLIVLGRQPHHQSLRERFAAPPPPSGNPTPAETMAYRLRTPTGKRFYALRKHPGTGVRDQVMGFRQFLLRGLDQVRGEWSLVTNGLEHQENVCAQPRMSAPSTGPNRQRRCAKNSCRHPPNSVFEQFSAVNSVQYGLPAVIRNLSPTGCCWQLLSEDCEGYGVGRVYRPTMLAGASACPLSSASSSSRVSPGFSLPGSMSVAMIVIMKWCSE